MLTTISYVFFLAVTVTDLLLMLKCDMHMLQLGSYYNSRYCNWIAGSDEYLSVKRLIALVVLIGSFTTMALISPYVVVLLAVILLGQAVSLARKKNKKPLVFTRRVKRLYFTEVALMLVAMAVVYSTKLDVTGLYYASVTGVLFITFSYVFTMAVNWLMQPVERRINQRYVHDAQQRLARMPHMQVIGISGSYGKTSTKHYLYKILSEQYSVLMTPKSYNTLMGVVRTIREMMTPDNEVFICEMGAINLGDVKQICDVVHPRYGIITAVGEQSLGTFKTIDNVQRAQFELADALPPDGLAVVNEDYSMLPFRPIDNVECKRYAVKAGPRVDYHLEDIDYTPQGTTFAVVGPGLRLELATRLVGEFNLSDLLAAVVMALRLNVPHDKIKHAVSSIEQLEHRLCMSRDKRGFTVIDDTHYSNPRSSRMALDVLSGMTGGRRIIVTPGLIELGDKQEYFNVRFGRDIAMASDVAVVVGEYNREAIVKGLQAKGFDKKNVKLVPTLEAAQRYVYSMVKAGDTVLYENDLPDTFK